MLLTFKYNIHNSLKCKFKHHEMLRYNAAMSIILKNWHRKWHHFTVCSRLQPQQICNTAGLPLNGCERSSLTKLHSFVSTHSVSLRHPIITLTSGRIQPFSVCLALPDQLLELRRCFQKSEDVPNRRHTQILPLLLSAVDFVGKQKDPQMDQRTRRLQAHI